MNIKAALTILLASFGPKLVQGEIPSALRGSTTNETSFYPKSEDEPGSSEDYLWPTPISGGNGSDYVWPNMMANGTENITNGTIGHGRDLQADANCGIFAGDTGDYAHASADQCYNLVGTWWSDKVTWVRASAGTCIGIADEWTGRTANYCGSDWIQLGDLSRQVTKVCCPRKRAQPTGPVGSCTGNGGACSCGKASDGNIISMNRFHGDHNDNQVYGCGGAFHLSGADWSSQWGGTVSATGPEASVAHSAGLSFSQGASADGWEGCCYTCGANLQIAGKISDGWYCEKDFFSTGIWLKGKYA